MFKKSYDRDKESLGAFEISADMLELAKHNFGSNTFLNAGRGNPNWINTRGRLAFCRIMEFGIAESRRTIDLGDLAGYTVEQGIYQRLLGFLDKDRDIDRFILNSVRYVKESLDIDEDVFVKEMADAVIGNTYPVPSRDLPSIGRILSGFVEDILFRGTGLHSTTDIFPTEGGTAAIVYIFDSLKHNGLLNEGDKIAINVPIFTPYLQIPKLTNFDFVPINVSSNEENHWQITGSDIDKLRDQSIKAFFLVNPSNPGAHSLDNETLEHIEKLVKDRPELMIITDDVYGTFAENFRSVYAIAPHNTLLVYSFSKLYGATGWRTGLIALNRDNVFDRLIRELPEGRKRMLHYDYSIVTTEPENMAFIDRICADSRNIGLYHTSGLSTPQQAMMALFALTHLLMAEDDTYIDSAKSIVSQRYHRLYHVLGLEEDNSGTNTKYYSLINIYKLAASRYGKDFSEYLEKHFDDETFMRRLAQEEGVVLMMGEGFDAAAGTLRISFANLDDDQYELIGYRILKTLEEYHKEYLKKK